MLSVVSVSRIMPMEFQKHSSSVFGLILCMGWNVLFQNSWGLLRIQLTLMYVNKMQIQQIQQTLKQWDIIFYLP